jgi:hypothetical protein
LNTNNTTGLGSRGISSVPSVNRKLTLTVASLGLTIPPALLATADEVIE